MGHAGAGVSGDAAPVEVPATAAEEDRPVARGGPGGARRADRQLVTSLVVKFAHAAVSSTPT